MLARKPAFTAVAALTLALGIGANTAMFSVVNGVLLRPLPYPAAERIMQIGSDYSGNQLEGVSEPKFLFWRDHNQSFDAMAAYLPGGGVNLAGGARPEHVSGVKASVEFFP